MSTVSITVGSRSTIIISGRDSSFDLQPWQKQWCSQFVILDPWWVHFGHRRMTTSVGLIQLLIVAFISLVADELSVVKYLFRATSFLGGCPRHTKKIQCTSSKERYVYFSTTSSRTSSTKCQWRMKFLVSHSSNAIVLKKDEWAADWWGKYHLSWFSHGIFTTHHNFSIILKQEKSNIKETSRSNFIPVSRNTALYPCN